MSRQGCVLIVDCTALETTEFHYHCLGPLMLLTLLRDAGHGNSELLEAMAEEGLDESGRTDGRWHRELAGRISARRPRMAFFYTFNGNYLDVIATARRLRETDPQVRILFGGPQVATAPERNLEAFPFIDAVFVGEADRYASDIVGLMDGEPGSGPVPGLFLRGAGGSIIPPPSAAVPPDLEGLPWPDYSLVGGPYPDTPVPLDVGRGCPYGCRFCTTGSFHHSRFRMRPAEGVVGQVRHLHETYGSSRFHFEHDLFTYDKARLLEICRGLAGIGPGLEWKCSSRADTLDTEMMAAMATAGCTKVFLGVETGSPRMQALIRKGLDPSAVPATIRELLRHGIRPIVSLVYGFPEETEEDLALSVALAFDCYDAGCWQVTPHRFTYLPDTPYTKEYLGDLVLDPGRGYVDIAGGGLPPWAADLVGEHPAIFPYYYTGPTLIPALYDGLIDFFASFLLPLNLWVPRGWAVVREAYGDDGLRLYRDLVSGLPGGSSDLVPDWEGDGPREFLDRLGVFLGCLAGSGDARLAALPGLFSEAAAGMGDEIPLPAL